MYFYRSIQLLSCYLDIDNRLLVSRIHEQRHRINHNDKVLIFEELLNPDNLVSVHYNSMHPFAVDLYKGANDMSQLFTNPIHSVYNVNESTSILRPKIWEQIPKKYLNGFNRKTKNPLIVHIEKPS